MNEKRAGRKASAWKKETIDSERKVIRKILEDFSEPSDQRAKLELALRRVNELATARSTQGQLRRFIYIVSALSHHLNHGGLSRSQVKTLGELASAILKFQGIQPSTSKLAFLYGDLHLVLSQIHWRSGQQWEAAWQQILSMYLSSQKASSGKGLPSLLIGIRALRLGHTSLASDALRTAESLGLEGRLLVRSRLERIKALQLSGDWNMVTRLLVETLNLNDLTSEERRELEWQGILHRALNEQDIGPIVQAVLPGKSHHESSYVCEAFFWSRITPSREWTQRFPTLRRLARDPKIDFKSEGFFLQCARALEKCYDYSTPYAIRLVHLGKILSRISDLLSVDKELLVLAAGLRWLGRGRSKYATELVLHQYQGLSLRLSRGKKTDVLALFHDLETSLVAPSHSSPRTAKRATVFKG